LFANVHVYDEIKAAYSDWAWGKGGPPEKQDFVYITDSLFANVAWVPGPPITITIHMQGFMSIQPEDNGAVRTWFDIALRQESTDEVYFEGEARLTGGHNPRLTCSGDLGEEDFTVTTDASKTTARINKNYVFSAQVDTTDLELQLQVAGRTDEAPAITGWGVLALVTLLVASAVFIMLRRKRVSAAALG
jgi:hypothetical protein